MPKLVVDGAKLKCGEGLSPGSLTVLPTRSTDGAEKPIATIDDYIPMVNIGAFGMCKTQSNPQVAAATSAAQGVLTPMPCIPVVTAAWSSGSDDVAVSNTKALTEDSTCSCQWSGTIEITDPGTSDLEVG
jgi:hypothetical protein